MTLNSHCHPRPANLQTFLGKTIKIKEEEETDCIQHTETKCFTSRLAWTANIFAFGHPTRRRGSGSSVSKTYTTCSTCAIEPALGPVLVEATADACSKETPSPVAVLPAPVPLSPESPSPAPAPVSEAL